MPGTKLAALAGATQLTGAVCITDANGVVHQYEDEAEAYEVWKDHVESLKHRRGAFYHEAVAPPEFRPAPKPVERVPVERAAPAFGPSGSTPTPKTKRTKRHSASDDS